MEIKDIKNKIEKAKIAMATANKEGNPHNTVVMCVKLENQKNNVPPHLKRRGLQGHLFLGCSEIKSSKLRPHSKECGFNFGHNNIIITDNYMKISVENIKYNPNVSLVFWEGEKGWRIDGKAEYCNSGDYLKFVKSLKENKEHPAKGVIVINVEKIQELG